MGLSGPRTKAVAGAHHVAEAGGSGGVRGILRGKQAKMTEKRNFGDVYLENHCEIGGYRHSGV